jgi:hypothetical protein
LLGQEHECWILSLEQQTRIGRNAAHPQTIDSADIPDPLISFASRVMPTNHADEVPVTKRIEVRKEQ